MVGLTNADRLCRVVALHDMMHGVLEEELVVLLMSIGYPRTGSTGHEHIAKRQGAEDERG